MTIAAPTPTHQRVLDLRAQLDALGFDWGCLGSFSQWLAWTFGVATIGELTEHEALEASVILQEGLKHMPAAPVAGHPPPGAGALPAAGSGA